MKSTRRLSWVLLLSLFIPLMAEGATFSYGTGVTFNTGSTTYRSAGKLDDTHVIAAYYDGGVGMAEIGTIDGTGITFGSEYQFAASVSSVEVNVLDSTHAVVVYSTSTTGYAVVATISGTSISYGTPVQFNTVLRSGVKNASLAVLDSTHIALEYATETGSGPFVTTTYAVAATISGTSITFGSATSLQASSNTYMSAVALDSTHVALLYGVGGSGVGYVRIASVSDTTMSFGSAVQFNASASDSTFAKTDATHGMISYRASADDKGYSIVATISGTSVSLGSANAVTAVTTYYPQTTGLSASGAILIYRDQNNSSYATARMLTAAGGTVTSDTAAVYLSESVNQYSALVALDSVSALILTNTKAFIATTDTTAPSAPSSFTASATTSTINLSWTNPVDSDFLSNTIRRSASGYPTSSTDGTAVASGVTGTSSSDTGLSDGTYYYSIFARDLRGNYSTAAHATATADATAPAVPSSFTATTAGTTISLSWTNPADSDFSSVSIRKDSSDYPTSITAGTAFVSNSTGTSASDSGLSDGSYFYSLFATDTVGNVSTGAHAAAAVITEIKSSGGSAQQGGGGGGGTASIVRALQLRTTAIVSTHPAATTPPGTTPSVSSPSLASTTTSTPTTALSVLTSVRTRLEERVQQQIAAKPSVAPMLKKMLARMQARIAKFSTRVSQR